MKASEVLRRYQAGERNFQGVNLRGQSFKGKDLSGVDFSEADIRSTNFTGANLVGANFCGAFAGLQSHWAIGLVVISWLLSGASGLISGFTSTLAALTFYDPSFNTTNSENVIAGMTLLIMLAGFFIITIRKSLEASLVAVAVAGASVGTVAVIRAIVGPVDGILFDPSLTWYDRGALARMLYSKISTNLTTFTGANAVTLVSTVIIAVVIAVAVTVNLTVAGAFAVAGVGAVMIAVTVAVAVATATATAGLGEVVLAGVVKCTVAGAFLLLSAYIGWRAMKGDKRDAWVRSFAIALAATGGTSFRGADLTVLKQLV